MDKMRNFSLSPTLENYSILVTKKNENILGDMFYAWKNATLLKYPTWSEIPKEILTKNFEKHKVDALSKKYKLNNLYKAWGLFYATGEQIYIEKVYEVIGDNRCSPSVRKEALKLYSENKQRYNNCEKSEIDSACFQSFDALENMMLLASQNSKEEKIKKAGDLFETIANEMFSKFE